MTKNGQTNMGLIIAAIITAIAAIAAAIINARSISEKQSAHQTQQAMQATISALYTASPQLGLVGITPIASSQSSSKQTPTAIQQILQQTTLSPTFTPPAKVTDTTVPTMTSTATNIPAPKIGDTLYQADWSQGMNGWAGDQSWKRVSGMLVNDGTGKGPAFIRAPYKPGDHNINDFAVEAEIQVVHMFASFGIISRWVDAELDQNGDSGYWAGYGWVNSFTANGNNVAWVASNGSPGPHGVLGTYEIGMDDKWHTYTEIVSGNEIQLLVDGNEIIKVTDNRHLDGGEIRLWSNGTSLNVRSFKITMQ